MADQKLTELAAEATPTDDDIMYLVDDPGGVGIGPTSKKVVISTMFNPLPGTLTLGNAGLHLLDTGGDHDLIISPGTDLSVDRILTLTTGDAARTITLSGNPTLSDWFDQSVKAAATPEFAGLGVGTAAPIVELEVEQADIARMGVTATDAGGREWHLGTAATGFTPAGASAGDLFFYDDTANAVKATLSSAGVFTATDFIVGDGGTIGIAGNELLTFNAAGNATFSGVGSVVVPDGAWVGADAACSWVFDSTSGDVSTLDKVGIGLAGPTSKLHAYDSAPLAGVSVFLDAVVGNDGSICTAIRKQSTSAAKIILELQNSTGAVFDVLANGNVGIDVAAGSIAAKCHIDNDGAIAQPVLALDQGDLSEGFIDFLGTSAASAVGPISTWTTGNSIQGFVRVEINGAAFWMPYYDSPTA